MSTAEDDVLYPKEHFDYRPPKDVFAYDENKWSIFTWVKPSLLSFKKRRTMTSLTVTREALVKTLEERFAKYPDPDNIPLPIWGEPGRHEYHLGITPLVHERYDAAVPSIVFSTPEALAYGHLGHRKAHAPTRTTVVEPWGTAEEILKFYKP